MSSPVPRNEKARIKNLTSYKILDTLPEDVYDDITSMAAFICKTPIALMTVIDSDRQWFKSRIGFAYTETTRDVSFCAHAIIDPDNIMVVNDALKDSRFSINPLVTSDPNIRFYAGAPICTSEGYALGTLCVIDRVPRKLTAEQLNALSALRRMIVRELEIRRSARELADSRKRYGIYMAQKAKLEQMRNLTAHLESTKEAERIRISREVHDGLGQLLTGLKIDISLLTHNLSSKENMHSEGFQTLNGKIDRIINEVRKIAYELRPSELDDLGLAAAIESEIEALKNRTKMKFQFSELPDNIPLDSQKLTMAFRIFQEAMTNIIRHSGADLIKIDLKLQGPYLILSIQDNGRGIKDEEIQDKKSLGIISMMERARIAGGELKIKGSTKKGTNLVLKLALAKDSKKATDSKK